MIYALVFLYLLATLTQSKRLVLGSGFSLSVVLFPVTALVLIVVLTLLYIAPQNSALRRYFPLLVLMTVIAKNSIAAINPQLIGLSFGLFQLCYYLGKTINYRNAIQEILFFPQLPCGPVVRPENYQRSSGVSVKKEALYHCVFVLGLFLKTYPAYALEVLDRHEMGVLTGANFLVYLYADYLAWSLMGIAIAGLCGFKLPLNFKRPFWSRSIGEFWSCWNITLFKWTRSFVKLPIKNRNKRQYFNIFAYSTVLAIWHGIAINFVLFGACNIFLFRVQQGLRKYSIILANVIQGLFYLSMGLVFTWRWPDSILPAVQLKHYLYLIVALLLVAAVDCLSPRVYFQYFARYSKMLCFLLPVVTLFLVFFRPGYTSFYYARF